MEARHDHPPPLSRHRRGGRRAGAAAGRPPRGGRAGADVARRRAGGGFRDPTGTPGPRRGRPADRPVPGGGRAAGTDLQPLPHGFGAGPPEPRRRAGGAARRSRPAAVRTDGAFDPTVQPLWQLYAGHFARPGADPAGPPEAVLRAARELVDHRKLRVEPGRVAFAGRGMAVTLNGIAQGYVTDRVSERLRAEGMTDVLVDLGEIRALGHHPSGRPWSVGLADPLVEGRNAGTLEIAERAVATSGGYGTPFDAAGRFTHLFDPATGGCAREWLAVTVLAPDATTADALSTALSVAPEARAAVLLDRFPGTAARLTRRDGSVLALRA
nr:FAD:protein FMN transferase [Azospirillum brasilense]